MLWLVVYAYTLGEVTNIGHNLNIFALPGKNIALNATILERASILARPRNRYFLKFIVNYFSDT